MRGQSAVVLPVPGVEFAVRHGRDRYDPSARDGMPPHITLLYPFVPEAALTPAVLSALTGLCASAPATAFVFRHVSHFPGVLYLEPEPADHPRALTVAISERWPDCAPYQGRHDDVRPHLTVAYGTAAELAEVEEDLTRRLPLRADVDAAALYLFDGRRWQLRSVLPLHAPEP